MKPVSAPPATGRFVFDLCPACSFFAGGEEGKRHCTECGAALIHECPRCAVPIDNPYAKHCGRCGGAYREAKEQGRRGA
ncbi:MAG: hypothetical protein HYY93_00005 [Planctomycetes bacterium]|nr:hypothetical protein [Planctomycetota bacterium]